MYNENTKKSSFLKMPFSSSGRMAKVKGLPKLITTRLSSSNTSTTPTTATPTTDPSRSPFVPSPAAAKEEPVVSPAKQSSSEAVTVCSIETTRPVSKAEDFKANLEVQINSDDGDSNKTILVDLSSPAEEISPFDRACSIPLPLSPSPSLEGLADIVTSIPTGGFGRVTEVDPCLIPLPSSPSPESFIASIGLTDNSVDTVEPCPVSLSAPLAVESEEDAASSDLPADLPSLDSTSSSEELCSDSPLDPPDELSLTSSTEDDPMPSTPQSPAPILSRPTVEFAQVKSPVDRPPMATGIKQTLRKRISNHNFFSSHSNNSSNEATSPTSPMHGSFPSFFGRSTFGRKPSAPSVVPAPAPAPVSSPSEPSARSGPTVVGFQPAVATSKQTSAARSSPTLILASTDPNRPKAPPSDRAVSGQEKPKPTRSSSCDPQQRREQPQFQGHPSSARSNGVRKTSNGPNNLPLLPHPSAFTSSHSTWTSLSPTSPIGQTYNSSPTSPHGSDHRSVPMIKKRRAREGSARRPGGEHTSHERRASKVFIPSETSRAEWINILEEKERSRDRSVARKDSEEEDESKQYERAELCFML